MSYTRNYNTYSEYFLHDAAGTKKKINNNDTIFIKLIENFTFTKAGASISINIEGITIPKFKILQEKSSGSGHKPTITETNTFLDNLTGTAITISQKQDDAYTTILGHIESYTSTSNSSDPTNSTILLKTLNIKVERVTHPKYDSFASVNPDWENGVAWTTNGSIYNLLFAMRGLNQPADSGSFYVDNKTNGRYLTQVSDLSVVNLVDNTIYLSKQIESWDYELGRTGKIKEWLVEVWELIDIGTHLDCVRIAVKSGKIHPLKITGNSYQLHAISYYPV